MIKSKFLVFVLPLVALGSLGFFYNDHVRAMKDLAIFLSPFLLLITLICLFPRGQTGIEQLSRGILYLSAIVFIAQFIFLLLGYFNFTNRYEFRRDFVLGASILFFLTPLSYALYSKGKFGVAFIIITIASCATMTLTLSRDFILFSLLLVALIAAYKVNRRAASFIISMAPLYSIIYALAMYTLDPDLSDSSAAWRTIEFKSYLLSLNDDPIRFLLGSGFGGYLTTTVALRVDSELITEIPNYHSLWLYILFKFGAAGLGLAFYVSIAIVRLINIRSLQDFLLAYVAYYFLFVNGSTTGSFTQSFPSAFILAVIMFFISYRIEPRAPIHESTLYNKTDRF